jgi:hypothetical protein
MRTVARVVILFLISTAAVFGVASAASANMPTAVEYAVMLAYSPSGNLVTWPVGPS